MNDLMDQSTTRHSHADKNIVTRKLKAKKIERLIGFDEIGIIRGRLLDVGTGSDGISHYFAHHNYLQFEVHTVDVCDNLKLHDGFNFHLVQDCVLPFSDASFDIVISNHVIEHVGDKIEQIHHLSELRRVLKPNGVVYLATPNRWMLKEPHYQLLLLSWLPPNIRSSYLRWRRGIKHYDCTPLSLQELQRMISLSGFDFENKGVQALRLTLELEYSKDSALNCLFAAVPDNILYKMRGLIPTHIFLMKPKMVSKV